MNHFLQVLTHTAYIYTADQHETAAAIMSGMMTPAAPSRLDSLKAMVVKHKKSCLVVVALIIVAIIIIIVWAHNCPKDSFVNKFIPTWASPDYKLLKKNHIDKTRRSDSYVDTWSKADFIKSVDEFNKKAAVRSA